MTTEVYRFGILYDLFILLLQYETVMIMNLSYLLVLFESVLVVKSY